MIHLGVVHRDLANLIVFYLMDIIERPIQIDVQAFLKAFSPFITKSKLLHLNPIEHEWFLIKNEIRKLLDTGLAAEKSVEKFLKEKSESICY